MPFGKPDIFEAKAIPVQDGWGNTASWSVPKAEEKPEWHEDDEKKKKFGIELGKGYPNDFEAAKVAFDGDTTSAMWACRHWINDPIVNVAKDLYLKTVAENSSLLDKDQLGAKLLKFADEKVLIGDKIHYVNEGKDRVAALKLYSEVMGYTGKVAIDASTNIFQHNEMKIKFVKPEPKEQQIETIEHNERPVNNDLVSASPIKIKLVK